MNQLKTIRKKENRNAGYVYLYCLGNSWKAFGRSAYYLTLLYPGLEVMKGDDHSAIGVFVFIPDDCLIELFEENHTSVGDEYIEMKVPPRINCAEEGYLKWYNELLETVEHE